MSDRPNRGRWTNVECTLGILPDVYTSLTVTLSAESDEAWVVTKIIDPVTNQYLETDALIVPNGELGSHDWNALVLGEIQAARQYLTPVV